MKIYLVILIHLIFLIQLFPQSGNFRNGPVNFKDNYSPLPSISGFINVKRTFDDELVFGNQFGITTNCNSILLHAVDDSAVNRNMHLEYDSTSRYDNIKSKSFFKSNLFYFLGTAVAIITVYFVLNRRDKPSNTAETFGLPPSPK
jgi:hypothetical protein